MGNPRTKLAVYLEYHQTSPGEFSTTLDSERTSHMGWLLLFLKQGIRYNTPQTSPNQCFLPSPILGPIEHWPKKIGHQFVWAPWGGCSGWSPPWPHVPTAAQWRCNPTFSSCQVKPRGVFLEIWEIHRGKNPANPRDLHSRIHCPPVLTHRDPEFRGITTQVSWGWNS